MVANVPAPAHLVAKAPTDESTACGAGSDSSHSPESIFSTNTMIGVSDLAKSGLQQPAHSANSITRYYESSPALNLSYNKHNSNSLPQPVPIYANQASASQPIDLSNKVDSSRAFTRYPQSDCRNLSTGGHIASGNGGNMPTTILPHGAFAPHPNLANSDNFNGWKHG